MQGTINFHPIAWCPDGAAVRIDTPELSAECKTLYAFFLDKEEQLAALGIKHGDTVHVRVEGTSAQIRKSEHDEVFFSSGISKG